MAETDIKEKKSSRAVTWLQNNPLWACVIVLSMIAIVAGLLLGGVNQLTYESPEVKLAKNLKKAYSEYEGAWEAQEYDVVSVGNAKLTGVSKATDCENVIYAYQTTAKGFKSGLNLIVIVENNKIVSIYKTASSETYDKPFKEEYFTGQFYNVDITAVDFTGYMLKGKKNNGNGNYGIDAYTTATYTSKGICDSVNVVVAAHKAITGGAK